MVLLDNNIFMKCPPKTAIMLRILKKKMVNCLNYILIYSDILLFLNFSIVYII